MLWNNELEEFLEWFKDLANTDESKLKAALRSVPEASWGTAWCRLEVALDEEESRYLPPVNTFTPGSRIRGWIPTPEDLHNSDVIEKKKRILADEQSRRFSNRQ